MARLADYNFSIKYRAGKKHIDADYLSRHPITDFEKHVDACDNVLQGDDVRLVLKDASKNVSNPSSPLIDVNLLTLQGQTDVASVKPLTTEELIKAQRDDRIVGPVYDAVLDKVRLSNSDTKKLDRATRLLLSQFKKLSLVNGVLMRNTTTANQFVLPSCYHQMRPPPNNQPRKNNAGPALAEMAEFAGNGGKWREVAGNGGKYKKSIFAILLFLQIIISVSISQISLKLLIS